MSAARLLAAALLLGAGGLGGAGLHAAASQPALPAPPQPAAAPVSSAASAASAQPASSQAAPARTDAAAEPDVAAMAGRALAARDLAALARGLGLERVQPDESFGARYAPAAAAFGASWLPAPDLEAASPRPPAGGRAPHRGAAAATALAPAPALDFVAVVGHADDAARSPAASMLSTLATDDDEPATPGLAPAGRAHALPGRVRPAFEAVADAVPVPEPAMLWMLLPGLLVVWAGAMRRRR